MSLRSVYKADPAAGFFTATATWVLDLDMTGANTVDGTLYVLSANATTVVTYSLYGFTIPGAATLVLVAPNLLTIGPSIGIGLAILPSFANFRYPNARLSFAVSGATPSITLVCDAVANQKAEVAG